MGKEKNDADITTTPANLWRTAKVFTKAEGFGKGVELEELRIIDIRPGEAVDDALIRQGFDPEQSRAVII